MVNQNQCYVVFCSIMCTCITGTWTYVGVQASIQGLTYDTESTHS